MGQIVEREGRGGPRGGDWKRTPLDKAILHDPGKHGVPNSRLDHEAPNTFSFGGISLPEGLSPGEECLLLQLYDPKLRPKGPDGVETLKPPPAIVTVALDTEEAARERNTARAANLSFQHPEILPDPFTVYEKKESPQSKIIDWLRAVRSKNKRFVQELAVRSGIYPKEMHDQAVLEGNDFEVLEGKVENTLNRIQEIAQSPHKKEILASAALKAGRDARDRLQQLADNVTLAYLYYQNDRDKIQERAALGLALAITTREMQSTYIIACNTMPPAAPITAPLPPEPTGAATAKAEGTPTSIVIGQLTPEAQRQQKKAETNLNAFLQKNSPFDKFYQSRTVINFAVNRGNPDNPDWVTVVSDGRLTRRPSDNNPVFSIEGGSLYSVSYDPATLAVLGTKKLDQPSGQVAYIKYDPNADQFQYFDAQGKLLDSVLRQGVPVQAAPTTQSSEPTAKDSPTSAAPIETPPPPTVEPVKFHSNTWSGSPDFSTNTLGIVLTQGTGTFRVVVTDDVLQGTDWWRYLNFGGWSPAHIRDLSQVSGVSLSSVLAQTRGGISDFLNSEVNTDHHLDEQFSVLSKNFPNTDNVTYTLGKGKDGKIWIMQVTDNSDPKDVKNYSVNPDGTLGEAPATPTPTVVKERTPTPNEIIWKSSNTITHNDDSRSWKDPGWTNLQQNGGRIEVMPGGFIRYHVTQDGNVRVQLGKWGETISSPYSVIVPFRFSKGLKYTGDMNVISAFNKTGEQDGIWHNVATVDIDRLSRPFLAPMDKNDEIADRIYLPGFFAVKPDIFYTYELRVNPDRTLVMNIDWDDIDPGTGQMTHYHKSVSSKMTNDGGDPILKNVHSSAYIYGVKLDSPDEHVDNGPLEVVEWNK